MPGVLNALLARLRLNRRIVLFVPLATFVFGVGLSLYIFTSWHTSETADARASFTKLAADHMVAARANVLRAAIAADYLGTVFEAAGDLDRVGFRYFAAKVLKNNPAIERLAWLPIVPASKVASTKTEAAVQGIEKFRITEHDGLGGLAGAPPRDVYYPIFYISPNAGGSSLTGLDFGSDPSARKAMEKAAQGGSYVAIPNKAGFLDSNEPSFFVFIPVHVRASAAADRTLRGFVVGEISLRRVVHDGAPPSGPTAPQVAIFDLSAPLSDQLIYPARLEGVADANVAAASGSFWDIDMGVATWRIAALPKGPLEPGVTWQSSLILAGGLIISANLSGYLLLLLRRRTRVEDVVRLRTEELEIALRQLRVTEERLRDYVTTATDWSWDAGPDFRFTTVADRAREFGIDPGLLIGLDRLIDGDAPTAIEKRVDVLSRHQPFKDLRYDYPLGNRMLSLSLSGMPKFDDNGKFRGYRGSARDITPQLRAEAEQRTARWAAEQANRAKSAFLANMSHEIRTPMNGVLGMVQILGKTELNSEQRRMCKIIAHSGNTLMQILNDILDFSKLEAGRIELENIDCCLTDVVGDVVSLMRHTAEAKGISLVFEQELTASSWIVGDPTRMRQVLFNLISNAIKFSSRGTIFVGLRTEGVADGKLRFSLSVADQGIGMSADEQRRLFRRFTQADISSTRRFGGTGLGLSITRELVELMGGSIAIDSKLGAGSTFTVALTLPVAASRDAPAQSGAEARPEGSPIQLNVLVAEDDQINRMVIRMMLEPEGHTVTLVENGREAIEAVSTMSYDLVLMDVMMPDTDGVEATRQIRAMPPPACRVPIIALTANAMAGDRDKYLAVGMNGYVAKPVENQELFAAIEHVLGVRAWTPSGASPAAIPAPSVEALERLEDFISSL